MIDKNIQLVHCNNYSSNVIYNYKSVGTSSKIMGALPFMWAQNTNWIHCFKNCKESYIKQLWIKVKLYVKLRHRGDIV